MEHTCVQELKWFFAVYNEIAFPGFDFYQNFMISVYQEYTMHTSETNWFVDSTSI